jgi:hypothetical protein
VVVPEGVASLPRRRLALGLSDFPIGRGTRSGEERVDIVNGPECQTEDVLVLQDFSEGWWALRNPDLSLAVTMAWDAQVFPYLWSWQVYGGSMGYPYYGRAYTLGLEPFTCPFEPLARLAERNAAPVLRAGETVATEFEMGIAAADRQITHAGRDGQVRFVDASAVIPKT